MVEALLPEVEIADLPLGVHGWTGFLDQYTHISGAARAAGLAESVSALLALSRRLVLMPRSVSVLRSLSS